MGGKCTRENPCGGNMQFPQDLIPRGAKPLTHCVASALYNVIFLSPLWGEDVVIKLKKYSFCNIPMKFQRNSLTRTKKAAYLRASYHEWSCRNFSWTVFIFCIMIGKTLPVKVLKGRWQKNSQCVLFYFCSTHCIPLNQSFAFHNIIVNDECCTCAA